MTADWNPDKMRLNLTRHLRRIETLYAELPERAYQDANASDFPGGQALNMIGPVSVAAAWEAVYEAKEAAGFRHPEADPRTDDPAWDQVSSEEHPLYQLESWSRILREELDLPTSLSATVSREVAFLTSERVLGFLCAGHLEPVFAGVLVMEAELRTLVRRMEDVLHDGIRADLGVECLTCGTRLVKVWAVDEKRDRYVCRPCGIEYEGQEYSNALRHSYLVHAEWLTSEDMQTMWGIKRGSLSAWASGDEPRVRKQANVILNRVVYNVADAKAEHARRNAEKIPS